MSAGGPQIKYTLGEAMPIIPHKRTFSEMVGMNRFGKKEMEELDEDDKEDIGTNDILNWALRNKKIYTLDLYFVLKVPLFPFGSGKTKKGKNLNPFYKMLWIMRRCGSKKITDDPEDP